MSCPICGNPTEKPFRPFCSKRCADQDLAKWFNGSYAIPIGADEDTDASDVPASEVDPDKPH